MKTNDYLLSLLNAHRYEKMGMEREAHLSYPPLEQYKNIQKKRQELFGMESCCLHDGILSVSEKKMDNNFLVTLKGHDWGTNSQQYDIIMTFKSKKSFRAINNRFIYSFAFDGESAGFLVWEDIFSTLKKVSGPVSGIQLQTTPRPIKDYYSSDYYEANLCIHQNTNKIQIIPCYWTNHRRIYVFNEGSIVPIEQVYTDIGKAKVSIRGQDKITSPVKLNEHLQTNKVISHARKKFSPVFSR